MLQALDQFSDVGVRVIKASKVATIDSLHQFQPVLNQLAASGDDFVNAFNVFLTYPFVNEVVGRDPQVARNLHMGDYTNLSITLDLDLTQGLSTNPTDVLPTELDPNQLVQNVLDCIASGNLASPACVKVLNTPAALLKLKELCQEPANRNKTVCIAAQHRPRPARAAGGRLQPGPAEPARRPGRTECSARSGSAAAAPARGTTPHTVDRRWPSSQTAYDPSLVNLLVPTLVAPADGAERPARRLGATPSDHSPYQDPAA